MRTFRRVLIGLTAAGVLACWPAAAASAHPLGNFSVNTSARVVVSPNEIAVGYVVDLAEIPTFQAFPDAASGDEPDGPAQDAYRASQCRALGDRLELVVDGQRSPLVAGAGTLAFVDGSAGLLTARLECDYSADVTIAATSSVTFVDRNHEGQVGWREVWAQGDSMTLTSSDVASSSPSDFLTAYPEDRIESPSAQTSAALTVRPGGPALATDREPAITPSVPGTSGLTSRFSELVASHRLTLGVGLAGIAVAFVLGSMHAVAPGHGKTVMAAYLVGQRGTLRDALAVGATVTATHTAGVLVLGAILSTSTAVSPSDLYPWLGMISGALVASIGVSLLVRATRSYRRGGAFAFHVHTRAVTPAPARERVAALAFAGASAPAPVPAHHHDHHGHDHHGHDHHGHEHHRPDGHVHSHEDVDGLGWRSLLTMGFAGGMVPSPSALVVLLGAIALGRTWFGVSLVVAYGAGMAMTLLVAGLLLVRARDRIERIVASERGQRFSRSFAVLPVVTAALIVVGGTIVATRAALPLL